MDRLLDAYLIGMLELEEYQEKKNELMEKKGGIEQRLKDFERKGNHWLELTRNWILEASQAKNLALQEEDFSGMKNLLKKIGSNSQIAHQRLSIDFKKPWNYLYFLPPQARAEGEGDATNSIWWS